MLIANMGEAFIHKYTTATTKNLKISRKNSKDSKKAKLGFAPFVIFFVADILSNI